MPGGLEPSIYDDITQKLEQNGGLDEKAYRTFVVMALRDIGRGVQKINKLEDRVEALEESSLVLLAKKHPKATIALLTFFSVLTASAVLHLGLVEWALHLLGIPAP